MSPTSTDLGSAQRAQPLSQERVPDLARYTLQPLQRGAEFDLFRGSHRGLGEGSRPPILVRAPVADDPSPASLRKMQEEYALRSELDPAYVVRSLSLAQVHGRPVLVLEDPGGTPLDLLLDGAMEMAPFLRVAISAASALGHVHSRGLVHKDIKPANILVNTARDRAWLMGLGVASRLPRERQSVQPREFADGTLAYMAPEQTGRMNRSIDSRSDLYALGVTFYEMLTGTLPFTAADPIELVHCHIARQPTAPGERRKGVPRPVAAIILKLLAKTAEERYQTAAGLERDLRRCLAEWERQHRIDHFPLGEQDTPDRLLIPEKLYGRESEIKLLLAAFDRIVHGGKPELVLVSGYSGIGKSSVVNELQKSLVAPRGLFASGKFDHYERDIPYATLAQAFQSLIRPLLSKSEGELGQWRDALQDALGANAKLIANLVPELQLILGEPPPVPELPLQDDQRRFQLVLRRFMAVFASPEHPLALFLDDLQWLDSATLDWIEDVLTQSDVRHLMLIGAYRDNEVDTSHPLRARLDAIRKAGAGVQEIVLAPLTREDLAALITDSFHCEPEGASALAGLIHEKTAGNPFFAIQFIAALVEAGLATFDYAEGRWCWDLKSIRAKGYTDNVVDLMLGKLNRLPVETQQAVQLLACLGNGADFAVLEVVSGRPKQELDGQLWEAIRAGLIFRAERSYRFLHDRVQEAAYSLIPEDVRAETHLRTGRLLAARIPAQGREEAIFEILNQLNRGAHLITSGEERRGLAELNLMAGRRAKSSTAYASALSYLGAARESLSEDSWDEQYELTFSIEYETAGCELLSADMAAAEQRLSMLAERARSAHDIAVVTRLRLTLYAALDRSDRSVEICLEYLRLGGTNWPAHPTTDAVRREYDRVWSVLAERQIEELLDLPLLADPGIRDVLDVLTEIVPTALLVDFDLCALVLCRMVNLSLEYGNSDASCFAYVWFGTIAGERFDNPKDGIRFGQLGYDLVEKRGLRRYQARTTKAFASQVMPRIEHARKCRERVRSAFHAANQMGDLTHAAYSVSQLVFNLLFVGDPLAEVQLEAENGLEFVKRARFRLAVGYLGLKLQLIRTLRGLTDRFGSFNDQEFDEAAYEQHFAPSPGYWAVKVQALFFAGEYASAVDASLKARHWSVIRIPVLEQAGFRFYSALAHAACWDFASLDERPGHLAALTSHYRRLQVLAEQCAENFEHLAMLVGAELARIEGRVLDSEQLYEKAIRSAHANGFVHNEALAYELAARFYAGRGFHKFADAYLLEARYCYRRWGADGKVAQLDHQYPHLKKQGLISPPTSTIGDTVERLDLATVIKVSEAVSGEMVIEKLIDMIMRTAIEHAGAERGVLILLRDAEQRVAAEATTGGETVVVHMRDDRVSSAVLPESVLRCVVRTQESVILDDASVQNPFSTDPYVSQQQARSVLCLPLLSHGKLIGALYLENNLAPGVFAPARIAVLRLLASQAAMSLENTGLYRDLAERLTQRKRAEEALERSQFYLIEGQRLAHMGSWALNPAGFFDHWSHELFQIYGLDARNGAPTLERYLATVHPQDREFMADTIKKMNAGHCGCDLKKRIIRPDGELRYIRCVAIPVIDDGLLRGFLGTAIDITQQELLTQESQRRQAHLTEAQRLTHLGSWAYNHVTGKLTYWSDETFRLFGLDPRGGSLPELEEIRELIHPDERERAFEQLGRVFRDKAEYIQDYRVVLPDGTVRHLHSIGHPVLNSAGELVEYFGTVIDVTERKHTEQRLLAQQRVTHILAEVSAMEEAKAKILQALGECLGWDLGAIWRIDRNASVLRCDELWSRPSVEVAQFEAATRASVFRSGSGLPGRVWASGTPAQIPDVAQDPEFHLADIAAGEGLHAAFALPILLGSEVLGVIGFVSREVWQTDQNLLDMLATIGSQIGQFAERKRAESALQLAQAELAHVTRVMTMGELTASIAHEVNQPLGAIVTSAASCARWLAAEPPKMDKALRALERIVNDGRRASEVIRRIRALMKRQTPRKGWLDLNETILEVIAIAQYQLRRNEILLEMRLAQGLPRVQGDRVQLQQVLLNLIVNAIEAMSGIGERLRELTIVSATDGPDVVRIEVRDSGTGLDPERATQLFEAFYTTKAEGIGIGLSISRSIVEAHGGTLSAADNTPYGAVFRFSLPVQESVP